MPIDASIPLSGRMPQVQTPFDWAGGAAEIRNLRGAAQLNEEKLRVAQAERQQQEQQVQRMTAFRDALQKGADEQTLMGIDPDATVKLREIRSKQQAADLGNREKMVGFQTKLREQLSGPLMQLKLTPPEQRQQAYAAMQPQLRAMREQALAEGVPAEMMPELPADVPDDQTLSMMAFSSLAPEAQQKLFASIAAEQRAAATHAATLPGQQATSEVAQIGLAERTMPAAGPETPEQDVQAAWAEWRGGLPKSMQARINPTYSPEAAQRVETMAMSKNERAAAEQRKATMDAQTTRDAATAQYRQARLAQGGAGAGMRAGGAVSNYEPTPLPQGWKPGQLNETSLTKYPTTVQSKARQLVDYAIPLPTGTALKDPTWQAALQAASELDPTWKASEYQSRLALRKDMTSGRQARNITSINTAIGHLATLAESGKKLGTGPIRPWNQVSNWAITQGGDARTREFEIAADAVVNELATVFKGTGATDQEIKAWRSHISAADSPQQMQTAVGQAIELLGSRMEAIKNMWESGMGKPADFAVLSPKSRKVLAGIGVDVDALEPQQGGGAALESSAKPQGGAAQGGGRPLDRSTAKQYLEAAGGDKQRARQLAVRDGWRLQ